MKLRKCWKRFWTLDRHHAEGFTLVELIVVIAILAILAGVGTAGYSGYIKNANKNADKILVGNIMRAIETGTNSTMFINDDSFKMGKISYPVGFVALSTTNGTRIVVSETEIYQPTTGDCKFETITVRYTEKTRNKYDCPSDYSSTRLDCYTIVEEEVTYCSKHTPLSVMPQLTTTDATFPATYIHTGTQNQTGNTCGVPTYECVGHDWLVDTYVTIPSGSYTVSNKDALYTRSDKDSSKCEAAYANQYGMYGTPTIDDAAVGNPLYDSITAAFGNNLDALTLSYDGWTSDESLGYASFYTGATELMGDLKDMAGTLAGFASNSWTADKLGLTQTYANTDEILTGVSSNLVAMYGSEDVFLNAWNNDVVMTWDSYGFNIEGRENYSALRAAYNSAFASYMDVNGFSAYSEAVRNYEKPLIGEFDAITLPALICTEAFENPESGLNAQLGCTDEEFGDIADLYRKYIESGACSENGSLMFDVFSTIDSTSDIAYAQKELSGKSVYDYYNSYVSEMSELYERAQTASDGGIVIIVVVEDGKLNFQVSPAAANPRED